MQKDKYAIFFDYSIEILSGNRTYRKKCEYLKSVSQFLMLSGDISKKEYISYKKKIFLNNQDKEAIMDFLSYIGESIRKRKKVVKTEKPLEKLSDISEKNRQLVHRYMEWLQEEYDFSQHTFDNYVFTVNDFFKYSNEFSMEQAKRYIRSLEEQGKKPKTINLRITGLEKFSEFTRKPIKLKRPKISKSLETNNIPTEKEYNTLLSFLKEKPNKDHYFWIKILATTGARVSEFLQFTWEDILRGEVVLKGKGSKYRRFFFSKGLQKEVEAYVKTLHKEGPVATGKYGKITSRGLSQSMKDWGEKCAIDKSKMHPHAFRHFFAKMYLKKNKDIVQLADILGHGSIDTTRIYLQKSYDEQKEDFNRSVIW